MKQHSRIPALAIVSALIAGCGGGGSDGSSVDDYPELVPVANGAPAPAAPPAAVDSPAPVIAPSTPVADATPAPSARPPVSRTPAPAPVTSRPPLTTNPSPVQPAPAPAPQTPAPVQPPVPVTLPGMVDGAAISVAMGWRITGPVGAGTVATAADGTEVHVYQDSHMDRFDPGTYTYGHMPIQHDLYPLQMRITTREGTNGIGQDLIVNGIALERPDAWVPGAAFHPTYQPIATWANTIGWTVSVELHDATMPENFRLCWRTNLPSPIGQRLSCATHNRATGDFVGGVRVEADGRTWGF